MVKKFLVFVILGVGFILVSSTFSYSYSYLRESTTKNTTLTMNILNNPINFTTFFLENKDFEQCYGLGTTCVNAIDVLFESPKTVALSSQFTDLVWMAVDEVKKDGYEIDDVTTFETIGFSSNVPSTNFLVVMSK